MVKKHFSKGYNIPDIYRTLKERVSNLSPQTHWKAFFFSARFNNKRARLMVTLYETRYSCVNEPN